MRPLSHRQPSSSTENRQTSTTGVGIDWTFASLDEASGSTWSGFVGRAVAVAVSLGGVCITALLLGIVSEQIGHWIEDLKRGRSEVHNCRNGEVVAPYPI